MISDTITSGDLRLDLPCLRATWRGREVRLTASEFRIVALLASRSGIVSHAAIADLKLDKRNRERPRNVAATVKRIRRAFEAIDHGFTAIETVYGDGYRWCQGVPERIAA